MAPEVVGSEVLGADESLAALDSADIARIVLSIDCLPAARPVIIALVDGQVIVGIPAGPELDAARRGDVVGIEIDGVDPDQSSLWSVSVTGISRPLDGLPSEVTDHQRQNLAQVLEIGGGLIAIPASILSGRRIMLHAR
jgi:hypothetical protein